jgi:hypothetical protein
MLSVIMVNVVKLSVVASLNLSIAIVHAVV